MSDQQQQLPILLDCHQAAAFVGVSLRKFRAMVKDPTFPAARALGPRSTRWHRIELETYAASLPAVKRDEPAHLAAAREARAKGQPTAHAPFPAPVPTPRAGRTWKEIR